MNALVPSGGSWLTRPRVVGTPLHWAKGSALYGGLVGGWAPLAWMLYVEFLAPSAALALYPLFILPGLLSGILVGGALGLVQPALLDRVRGRVRLPVLALAQAGVGAFAGAVVGLAYPLVLAVIQAMAATRIEVMLLWQIGVAMAGVGALTGALTTLTWWLPYTVATVLKARTWPITVAAAASSPLWLLMISYALAMLLF